jgi:hypothetical protein
MKKTSLLLALALTAPVAVAQNCFSAAPTGTLLGNLQDTIYPAQAIGFAFPLAGTTYTDIHISDHGIAFLSNGGVPTPPVATPFVYTPSTANFGIANPMIAAMWSDTVGGGTNSGVYITSSATSCRVEWRNMVSFGFNTQFNLAMTLFPSGNIQFDYDPLVTNNSNFGGVSDNGIAGVTTGGVLPAAVDLSAGGATTNNIVFENWIVANTFDMQNNSLLLIPTNPGWSYVLLGASACATASNYGTGCGGDPADSVYEGYSASTFDLVGAPAIQFLRVGTGYVVLNGAGTFVTPTAGASPVAPGLLDGQTSFTLPSAMPIAGGSTTNVTITTKGNVEFTAGPVTLDFTPTTGELLNRADTGFHCWHDFDQTTAGAITWEVIGNVGYATWNGVESFSSPGLSTVQWQFDLASGNATLVVVSAGGIVDPANPDDTVVGYSVGGASSDPGSTDLGTIPGSVVISDTPAVLSALALTNNGVPFVGNAAFGYTVTNVPALVPLAFLFFGDTNPAIPLDAIGMTGCTAWTNANFGSVSFPVAANTGSFTLPIPGTPSLVGTAFTSMGLAFSLATPLNLITSNGNLATIGN